MNNEINIKEDIYELIFFIKYGKNISKSNSIIYLLFFKKKNR